MNIQGSPEWFHNRAVTQDKNQLQDFIENMRSKFITRFSSERLMEMDGAELLSKVFGNNDGCMIRLLMFDDDYRWFGAPGKYVYLGIVFQKQDGSWCYKEGINTEIISRSEAERKAQYVRDLLISCIEEIKMIADESGFDLIGSYEKLDERLSRFFLYKHSWVIKYYQMIYPEYFAGMYSDHTIERAQKILGLPNHGKSKRIVNIGEISLFIRRCDVNNIIFNEVYAEEWGWDKDYAICANAEKNYEERLNPVKNKNVGYYRTPRADQFNKQMNVDTVRTIEQDTHTSLLSGEERTALVKIRINQSIFREDLIKRYGKCCLCGVNNRDVLVASHIKPWAHSEDVEKLDVDNGLLLCPGHDKLFDKGLISFDDDGLIMISDSLDSVNRIFLNVHDDMKITLTEGNRRYMSYHRVNIYDA